MKLLTGISIVVFCGGAVRAVAWVATWLGKHF
jgi:hypothetical protein